MWCGGHHLQQFVAMQPASAFHHYDQLHSVSQRFWVLCQMQVTISGTFSAVELACSIIADKLAAHHRLRSGDDRHLDDSPRGHHHEIDLPH